MIMAANHIAAAEEIATRIIDDFTITDKFPSKDGAPRLSKELDSKPEWGPVWMLLTIRYTVEVIDPSKDGLTAFNVIPDEYVKYRAAVKAELQKVENWRQLIVKKSFVLTAKDYGLIDI